MKERIEESETIQSKVIFPNCLNDQGNLFGGLAMQWMDEVAYITASRFTRMKMVTTSSKGIRFRNSVKLGNIVDVKGKVLSVGNVKIDVKVELFAENIHTKEQYLAIDGTFTFVAVDENDKPVRLIV